MQKKYSPEKLEVILLSVDHSKAFYDSRASSLFKKYGGGNWPSVILNGGFDEAMRFADFGYGTVIIDQKGIVRAMDSYDFDKVLKPLLEDK